MSAFDEQDLLERLQETLPKVLVYPSDQVPAGTLQCIHYSRLEFNEGLLRLHVRAATDEAMDAMMEDIYWALPEQLADKASIYRDSGPHASRTCQMAIANQSWKFISERWRVGPEWIGSHQPVLHPPTLKNRGQCSGYHHQQV